VSGEHIRSDPLRDRLAHLPQLTDTPLDDSWLTHPDEVSTNPAVLDPAGPERRRRRRRWPWVFLVFAIILGVVIGGPAIVAWRTFNSIERVAVSHVFAPSPSGRNILIVGTDSREGIDTSTDNAGFILGEGITGQRSDTILILHIGEDGTQQMLSLPRDLWLPINNGSPQRINTAIAQGPDALITTIQNELNIPISNYVEVDLAGFIDVVDAVGGVTIEVPYPAFDRASGLNLPIAGEVTLDSTQALAYVRSRRYTEVIDGVERSDPTSDLGRVKRQQAFLAALLQKVTAERNPIDMTSLLDSVADAVRIDDAIGFTEVANLALDIRSGLPTSTELPTRPNRINGNAVLELTDSAPAVIEEFVTAGDTP